MSPSTSDVHDPALPAGAARPAARWRSTAALVVGLLGVLLTARLGWWQLDRAQQKLDLQARLEARVALPPLAPAELPRDAAVAAAQYDRAALLRGHWLPRHTVYLENRQMDGRPGFYVVTPLQLPDGDAVLVQRGWMPRDFQDRSRLQPLAEQPGEVLVRGRLAPPPARLLALGEAGTGAIRQNLDVAAFATEIGQTLRPWTLLQTAPTEIAAGAAAGDGLKRDWPVVAAGVGKHHGYAAQWFGLSVLLLGLTLWFRLIRPWRAARRLTSSPT